MLEPDYPIATSRLLLRPFTLRDTDAIADMHSRPAVVRYLYTDVLTRPEVEELVERRVAMTSLLSEGDALTLVIEVAETGELAGDVLLSWVSAEHRQGEIGFVLHPDHHGLGYATESATEMLRLGFEGAGLHRIIGRCDARNDASARVMEKLGMRREAHLRQNEFVKGEWCDELVYALLDSEWEKSPP